jgi:hypothetical protein
MKADTCRTMPFGVKSRTDSSSWIDNDRARLGELSGDDNRPTTGDNQRVLKLRTAAAVG